MSALFYKTPKTMILTFYGVKNIEPNLWNINSNIQTLPKLNDSYSVYTHQNIESACERKLQM